MSIFYCYTSRDALAAEKAAPHCGQAPSSFLQSWEDDLRRLAGDASPLPANESAWLDLARHLKAMPEYNIEECLLIFGPRFIELYLVAGAPASNARNGRLATFADLAKSFSFFVTVSNQEAVMQFFRSALGWMPNGEHDPAHVEAFRRAYTLASEHKLAGLVLSRLFQRALWLYEKARLETDLFHHPNTVDEVLLEVAGKIFGGLKERAVLFVGSNGELPPLVKILQQAGIGHLYFALTGSEKPDAAGSGQIIDSWHEVSQLPAFDLMLLFNQAGRNIITRAYLQKLMAARQHSPLLLADLTAEESPAEMIKMYNLFYYRRRDLEGLVEQNATVRRQAEAEVTGWIRDEVREFYHWLNSADRFHFGSMVGRSPQMQQVFELIARIAQTDITVIIEGESGTGKELVARAIHQASTRARRPFIAVNCGALPENLLESELFGHVRGAFTGAVSNNPGLFEQANGGTIFLDEIGEMSPALQVKLLRFLQDGEIKRVGSNTVLKLNVRVLAATNRHLETLVHEGKFRSDLYYRLNVISIKLPPLRERPEDIEMLAEHFARKFAGRMRKTINALPPEVLQRLRQYAWPGNVRELENVMERAVALTGNATLEVVDLPAPLREAAGTTARTTRPPLKEIERQYILDTVAACNGNYEEAAKVLGIGRTTLWRKLKTYLDPQGDFEA
ncbi:MAG: sigma 54-interacting transcriptional regulator [candidate division KSB1 bacterium]|nr:sigma 54-interacting transcriptional regulator [candidate division KSB1 bacterium]MDZ7368283.1 sigma 54-interacting transcriptional regulator [candidate division KSB1 bacterium]MDZ7406137.1 sigma 54-interacting transcriptional regulator [candidate division KSB1 bacterium]